MKANQSNQVRGYVRERYIEPARRRGERQVTIVAGDVHRELGLQNRVPLVCNALKSRQLETECGVRVINVAGPPSGQSTTVRVTLDLTATGSSAQSGGTEDPTSESPLLGLMAIRGILKDTFRQLGGGEAFIRREREAFAEKELGGQ